MLNNFSLLIPRPNSSKLTTLKSKIVKYNAKKIFVFKITKTGKPVGKVLLFMAVTFIPEGFIHRFVAL